jgi:NADH-quinone oxidoreductase subunit L
MPAHTASAEAGAGTTHEAAAPAATAGHEAAPAAPAATAGHEAAAAAPTGVAPQGAIFMAPSNQVIEEAHHAPTWVKVSPFIAMLLGFGLAWLFYIRRPDYPGRLAETQPVVYRFLLNKWYFDEIYDVIFVRSAKAVGRFLWRKGDMGTIDGIINEVAMGIIPFFTRLAGRMQSGYLFHYAFAMVIGILFLLTWAVITGGSL